MKNLDAIFSDGYNDFVFEDRPVYRNNYVIGSPEWLAYDSGWYEALELSEEAENEILMDL